MNNTVTVIVCAYTRERDDQLMAALRSVRDQVPAPDEVLVVIDHNQDLLSWVRERIAELPSGGPATRVVASTGPRGLSGARNTGLELATGEVVAFLDDDAEAEPEWLANLVAPYRDPLVVSVGGWVEPVWEGERPEWFPDEFGWVVGCSYRGLSTTLAPVRNAIGANMSFRGSALIDAGGFSSRFGRNGSDGRGCEETEASIRVSRSVPGSRILLQPAARVRHHVPRGRGTWLYFRRRCYAEGQSKALVSNMLGRQDGLESERTYVRSTLPSAVASAVTLSWKHRDPAPLKPAAAILGGLVATASGYAMASARSPISKRNI